jgi:hypothetical protein
MRRSTLRLGTAAAAAAILLAAWFLLSGDPPAPPAGEGRVPRNLQALRDRPPAGLLRMPSIPTAASPTESGTGPPAPGASPPPAAARRVVVEGRVIGLGGEPVAGASVILLLPRAEPWGFEPATEAFLADPLRVPAGSEDVFSLMAEGTEAGADGTFRIEAAARPAAGLIAWGGAYANTIVEPFSLEEDVKGLVLRMEPAAALTGRVLEATGFHLAGRPAGPLAGVAVSLLRPVGEASGLRWIHLRTETTDAEGRFRTWGWTPGRYDLLLEKKGIRTRLLRSVEIPGDAGEIRLSPAATATLTGTVLLPDGATPAAGVVVRASAQAGGEPYPSVGEATTGGDGRFRIEGLAVADPARSWLSVVADGGDRGGAVLLDTRGWPATTEFTVVLGAPPRGVLRVRAADGSRGSGGAPAKGVRLVVRGAGGDPPGDGRPQVVEREAATDAAGVAEFRGVPSALVTVAPAPDEWGWETEKMPCVAIPDAPGAGEWEVGIALQPRGRVRGLVVGPGGEPVPGARVEVLAAEGERAAPAAARSGPGGAFLLPGVTTRRAVRLRVTAPGFLEGMSEAVSLDPGSTLEGLVLRLPGALAAICGRVVDEEGNPRPEVLVRAHPASPGSTDAPVTAWTGAGGRYRIEVPPGSTWSLGIELKGCRWSPTEPLLPGDPVPDLVLRPLEDAR